jgi:hypothetical protein
MQICPAIKVGRGAHTTDKQRSAFMLWGPPRLFVQMGARPSIDC